MQGQLLVTPHHNHACGACPVNMCKREILQMHHHSLTTGRSEPGSLRIAYVGDGGNDLCPAQSLGADDVVFVRAGYALDKMLQDPAVKDTVKARVHVWSSAAEILNVLRGL
jgi:pyridoxal phosphate phosphatase PHOSPHO2